jgi:hypothetical protein
MIDLDDKALFSDAFIKAHLHSEIALRQKKKNP